jgi:hypothetical protein
MMNGLCLGTCSSRGGREEHTPAAGGIHHRICVGEHLAKAVEDAGFRADPDRAESGTAEVSRGLLARLLGR